jgi:hypothetical protein
MTDKLALNEVEILVAERAQTIPAVAPFLPTFGFTMDGARPHVAVDASGYNYIVVERGRELTRSITRDIDELCYWIFEQSTFSLASKLSVADSQETEDHRRALFEIHVELMRQLSAEWASRLATKYQELLERIPFDDNGFLRAMRSGELREHGLDYDAAWNMALKEYPPLTLPTVEGGFKRKQ